MSEKQEKSPIRLVMELLADMTVRALEAERQRDEARKSSDERYGNWQRKDAALKEAEAKLASEIEEHQRTRETLREALDNLQKGAHHNGKSNQ